MQLISAILVIFWWIAIWGIFDIYTDGKTRDEKLHIYLLLLGIIVAAFCFYPDLLYRL